MRIVLGMAVLSNVLFMFATFAVPVEDAFRRGQAIGKSIGYQAGYRDGFEEASAMNKSTAHLAGADAINLGSSPNDREAIT
ncbi:hypothetical protein [Streptomyces sp. CC53]|uniref:hypothetical protein n=1 Tax=Streptomyces sp. CC53 TaxID=1906740 RepID=UPI00115F9EDC|nr:hypothetical protein [Streptomyces sp. CC53]